MKKLTPYLCVLLIIAGCKEETVINKDKTTASSAADGKIDLETPEDYMVFGRAMDAVIWGMPIVNYERMLKATERDANGSYGKIVYWPKLQDWNNQTLTPNPDVIYFMSFFNLKESGPMVLEIPQAVGGAINGTVMDCWQTAIEDVGPAGMDKGKGGKYFITAPDFKGTVPGGYYHMQSSTYQGFFLLRSILNGNKESDITVAVDYGKKLKFYPYSGGNSGKTDFIDMGGKMFDATIPYNTDFYQALDRMIQIEPWLERDKAMIDKLKSIGIERAKPYTTDEKLKSIQMSAIKEAHKWLSDYYETGYSFYFDNTHWFFPASPSFAESIQSNYVIPDTYPVDARGVTYHYAFFSAKHIGAGQYYLFSMKDSKGQPLDCAKNYRLKVPAKVPVNQYWSVTAYNRDTHTLIKNAKTLSRSSQSVGLKTNRDGSVDIYFGPKAPAGNETNWVDTGNTGQFEALFRFYGPEEALFKKTWQLPDVEEVK